MNPGNSLERMFDEVFGLPPITPPNDPVAADEASDGMRATPEEEVEQVNLRG